MLGIIYSTCIRINISSTYFKLIIMHAEHSIHQVKHYMFQVKNRNSQIGFGGGSQFKVFKGLFLVWILYMKLLSFKLCSCVWACLLSMHYLVSPFSIRLGLAHEIIRGHYKLRRDSWTLPVPLSLLWLQPPR